MILSITVPLLPNIVSGVGVHGDLSNLRALLLVQNSTICRCVMRRLVMRLYLLRLLTLDRYRLKSLTEQHGEVRQHSQPLAIQSIIQMEHHSTDDLISSMNRLRVMPSLSSQTILLILIIMSGMVRAGLALPTSIFRPLVVHFR